jgi:hypothetical protein
MLGDELMTNRDATTSPFSLRASQSVMAALILIVCGGCPPAPPSQEEQLRSVTSHWITVEPETPGDKATPCLDQNDLNVITNALPTISTVVGESVRTGTIESDDARVAARVCGTTPEYLRLLQEGARVQVQKGRFFESVEAEEGASVVVLSQDLAQRLFPHTEPVGESVVFERSPLTVVGVVTEGASWGSGLKRDAYVPIRLFAAGSDQSGMSSYHRFRFRVRSLDELKPTHQIIQAIVERRHPDKSLGVRSSLIHRK